MTHLFSLFIDLHFAAKIPLYIFQKNQNNGTLKKFDGPHNIFMDQKLLIDYPKT
jgi:hypothetical protein